MCLSFQLTVKRVSGAIGQVALILALHVMAQATKQEHGLPICMRPMVELIVLNLLRKIRPACIIVQVKNIIASQANDFITII